MAFSPVNKILDRYKSEVGSPFAEATEGHGKQRRISREWQDYAYRLAVELDDKDHTSLYMRLCKNTPRAILEEARTFVKGAANAKSKGRLYMWKVKELKEKAKEESILVR